VISSILESNLKNGKVNEGTKLIQKRFKMGCTMLIEQLVFLPIGDVTLCCNDLNSKVVIENIQMDSLFFHLFLF
jgi:hypothetical protein